MIIFNFLLQADSLINQTPTKLSNILGGVETSQISYFQFFMKGGVMIIPICLLLFVTFYIMFERYFAIKKVTKQDFTLMNDLKYQLKMGKIENALMLCKKEISASRNILKSGIAMIGRPVSEIESVMEKTTNIEIAQMEKHLGYLGLISGIAPILGFVGTITGVIKIFYSISVSENISIGNISGGLYEKMISSGAGLIVGVIAYSSYHLFNIMIDHFSLNAQKQILQLINIIQEPEYGDQKE